jgi:hypothetical protein
LALGNRRSGFVVAADICFSLLLSLLAPVNTEARIWVLLGRHRGEVYRRRSVPAGLAAASDVWSNVPVRNRSPCRKVLVDATVQRQILYRVLPYRGPNRRTGPEEGADARARFQARAVRAHDQGVRADPEVFEARGVVRSLDEVRDGDPDA